MEHDAGDEYLRRMAAFIRGNEKSLAEAGIPRRRPLRAKQTPDNLSYFNPLGWFGPATTAQTGPPKPIVLSIDTHHLFYILIRLEALGINVGTLDVQVDSPSRPMSYVNLFPDADKSETLSLASFRSSLSAVSNLSLGGGWWGRPEPPSVDAELKYLYSSFTKLPALSISAPGRKIIAELANQPPNENAIPLDSFKNLQSLEVVDIDPRTLLGWDRLAESLYSLKIRKSGLDDISDIFIGAVMDDQARREGSTSRKRTRRIPAGPERQVSFYATRLPESVAEDIEEEQETHAETSTSKPPSPAPPLSPLKWAFLKHLSLADNALALFPSDLIPFLTPITHLDLSSNLLVSVPSGLGALYNLVSLNLSDNMIDSVLGIYLNLGQVLYLNLANNRLESICGLERLHALERVDLRTNIVDDVAEIGRLATLPNITEVCVEGNPFTEDEGYRIPCFDFFWKEGKMITLDGSLPGYYEKRGLTVAPPQQMSSSRPISVAYSPPTVAVGHPHGHHTPQSQPSPSTSSNASPNLGPVGAVAVVGKPRRKKMKRIVELDGDQSDGSTKSSAHRRTRSDGSSKTKGKVILRKARDASPLNGAQQKEWGQFEQLLEDNNKKIDAPSPSAAAVEKSSSPPTILNSPKLKPSRHSRHYTDYIQTALPSTDEALPPSSSTLSGQSMRRPRGSQTMSLRSAARRARVTASVFDPPSNMSDEEHNQESLQDNGDAYRRKIEALKKDMGDGWLKVFSQTQLTAPTSPS